MTPIQMWNKLHLLRRWQLLFFFFYKSGVSVCVEHLAHLLIRLTCRGNNFCLRISKRKKKFFSTWPQFMYRDRQWDIMHLQNEAIRTAMPHLIGLYASVEILSVNVGQTGRVTCHWTQRITWFRVLIPEDKSQAARWLKLHDRICPLLYVVLHFFINCGFLDAQWKRHLD